MVDAEVRKTSVAWTPLITARAPVVEAVRTAVYGAASAEEALSDIQDGVLDDLAARTAEMPAEQHALRPVVFCAEWR